MAIKFNNNNVRRITYKDSSGTSNTVRKVVKDGTVVWVEPYTFSATRIKNDNLMDLTFSSSTNGVTVTKGIRDGLYSLGGSATAATWIITQFVFETTGTYYVRNFNYSSSNVVRCYMASFSDSAYPNNYWLEGSTLTFNITAANTTCNFCLYVSADKTGISINQTLQVYIGKRLRTAWLETEGAEQGEDYISSEITTSEEPLVKDSLPFAVADRGDVYNADRIRLQYYVGSNEEITTTTTGPTSLIAPSLTNSFAGNYGFTAYNANSYSCTCYWYATYYQTSSMGQQRRLPESGYNSFSIARSSNSSRQSTGLSPGTNVNVTVYAYFTAPKTTTKKYVTTNYNVTPSGLSNTIYSDSYETSTLVIRTFNGTVNLANVLLSIDNYIKTTETTSTTTVTSSTSNKALTT